MGQHSGDNNDIDAREEDNFRNSLGSFHPDESYDSVDQCYRCFWSLSEWKRLVSIWERRCQATANVKELTTTEHPSVYPSATLKDTTCDKCDFQISPLLWPPLFPSTSFESNADSHPISDTKVAFHLECIWKFIMEAVVLDINSALQCDCGTTQNHNGDACEDDGPVVDDSLSTARTSMNQQEKSVFMETVLRACDRRQARIGSGGNDDYVLDALWLVAAAAADEETLVRDKGTSTASTASPMSECLSDIIYQLCQTCSNLAKDQRSIEGSASTSLIRHISPVEWRGMFVSAMNEATAAACIDSNNATNHVDNRSTILKQWRVWARRQLPSLAQMVATVLYSWVFLDDQPLQPQTWQPNSKSDDCDKEKSRTADAATVLSFSSQICWQPLFRYPVAVDTKSCTTESPTQTRLDRFLHQLALMGLVATASAAATARTDTAASADIAATIDSPLGHQPNPHEMQLRPVFSTDTDGFSIHTLGTALTTQFVGNPTLLLIQTLDNEWLGYYTPVPWTTSSQAAIAGPSLNDDTASAPLDSFLFRLHPSWNIYRRKQVHPSPPPHCLDDAEWTPTKQKMEQQQRLQREPVQYLHIPVNAKTSRPDRLVGLVVGGCSGSRFGSSSQPRLHLTADLEQCLVTSQDSVFEEGPLLGTKDNDSEFDLLGCRFDVASLEAFAVITNEDNVRQNRAQTIASVKERVRQQCAKVDRTQFVDDFQSGLYVTSGGLFEHREQARGRADFCATGEDERQGYHIDGKAPTAPTTSQSHEQPS